MEKTKNIFQEYRRIVLPDTQANCFEGVCIGLDALMGQLQKNTGYCKDSVWEICLVDWSRMFKVYLN
jgi:hypothetical protein